MVVALLLQRDVELAGDDARLRGAAVEHVAEQYRRRRATRRQVGHAGARPGEAQAFVHGRSTVLGDDHVDVADGVDPWCPWPRS